MSPRHQLTLADRKRGCAVAKGRAGGRKVQASGKAHKLTSEERRRGGLATAAKRRKERERALITLALPAKRGSESSSEGITSDDVRAYRETQGVEDETPTSDLPALGASLAGKLMAGEGAIKALTTEAMKLHTVNPPPSVDPFTLSALKRFLPGPRSPLSLTRSQRAQVDLMIKDGWLMATGDSMLALTEKGRQAVGGSES